MAVKNYGIHDKWMDLDKLNNVDIKSVDGVIESVKINGEEAGGGSSDFSTAEVTMNYTLDGAEFIPDTTEFESILPYPENASSVDAQYFAVLVLTGNDKAYPILYKGECLCRGISALKNDVPYAYYIPSGEASVTGDIEMVADGFIINGNGSITVPLVQD